MGLGIGHIPVMGIGADAGRVKLVGSTLVVLDVGSSTARV